MAERFIFCTEEPEELNVSHCVVRYGYSDKCNEAEPFERMLVEFVRESYWFSETIVDLEGDITDYVLVEGKNIGHDQNLKLVDEEKQREKMERGIEIVDNACGGGTIHLLSENYVISGNGAGIGKRVMVECIYSFLNRNLRPNDHQAFNTISHKHILKVGMTCEL